MTKRHAQVSQAPTNPRAAGGPPRFDVADLYRGPLGDVDPRPADAVPVDEKLRQAYFWIVNHAIISPFYDHRVRRRAAGDVHLGEHQTRVVLPTAQSYSSYVLLPLLNLAVRRRCLLIGGPGRGKTAIAVLMGVLAGYNLAR
jgi:MoxR-like ATPase